MDKNFYSILENTYANAIELIETHAILDKYKDRALNVVNLTSGIGWGFHDYLRNVYHKHFEGNTRSHRVT